MSLRWRLVLTALAITLPMALLLPWLNTQYRDAGLRQGLVQYALDTMQTGGRARCEAAPDAFSVMPAPPPPAPAGDRPPPPKPLPSTDALNRRPPPPGGPMPGPPVELFAYDIDLQSRNPRAPIIPAHLAKAFARGDTGQTFDSPRRYQALVHMPWREGPCAVVLAQRALPMERSTDPAIWLAASAAVLISLFSLLLTIGPVIRRLRQLAARLPQSLSSTDAIPLTDGHDDEIGALAKAFDEAHARIGQHIRTQQAREQTLRDFLANTTHDVAIPLTVLLGHLDTLREQIRQPRMPDQDTLDAALREAHYLGALVHNLAAAAKLEAGTPILQHLLVDLSQVVSHVVMRHRPLARQEGIALDYSVPDATVSINGDSICIEQALSNVVLNAIRHNHRGGHVAVVLETVDDQFALRVIDDGPGIPAAERDQVLERHVRGRDPRGNASEGRGLGLDITHRIITAHGFELHLADAESGGLEVLIEGHISNAANTAG